MSTQQRSALDRAAPLVGRPVVWQPSPDGGIEFTRAGDELIRAGNGDTSRKALWRVSDNDLRVISRTQAGKLLQWSFSANSGGNGGSDAGSPWAMWRLRRLTELRAAYAYVNPTPAAQTGTWSNSSALLLYPGDAESAGRYSVPGATCNVEGSTRTYAVTVPASGRVGVLVGAATKGITALTVECGGVSQVFDVRPVASGTSGIINVAPCWLTGVPKGSQSLVVTVTTRASDQTFILLGPLVADLSEYIPAVMPAGARIAATFETAGEIVGNASSGSSDIAFNLADVGLWAGSFHGGQESSATFWDGERLLDIAAANTTIGVTQFRCVQRTEIAGQLACDIEHLFGSPNELMLAGSVSGSANMGRAYIQMSTTRADWTLIEGAERETSGTEVQIGRGDSITQAHPTLGGNLTITAYSAKLNGASVQPYREYWVRADATYAKMRLAVTPPEGTTAVNRIEWVSGLRYA